MDVRSEWMSPWTISHQPKRNPKIEEPILDLTLPASTSPITVNSPSSPPQINMRADGGKSLRLWTFKRHPTSEYNRCGMKLKGLKCLFSHYPPDSLSLAQRFDFRDSLSFILFYRHSVTHTHTVAPWGKRKRRLVCDNMACDWHHSHLSHYTPQTHFLLYVCHHVFDQSYDCM